MQEQLRTAPDEAPVDLDHLTYLAVFKGLNGSLNVKPSGSLTVSKQEDLMVTNVRLSHSSLNVIHAQNIHMGTRCPTKADDTNGDGHIDIEEAQRVVGPMIVPLDGDIGTQWGQYGYYPQTDAWGAYVYSRTASFKAFLTDLIGADDDLADGLVKMGAQNAVLFDSKVVLLQGIAPAIELPESVATLPELTKHETYPIACGVLKRVTYVPGVFEPDDVTVGTLPGVGPSSPGTVRPGPRFPGRRPLPSNGGGGQRTDEDKPGTGGSRGGR